jgi:hypothetical protein
MESDTATLKGRDFNRAELMIRQVEAKMIQSIPASGLHATSEGVFGSCV